jgi:2-polyprenyl-6-methoxyphenol hydroxylase-like FAD-dependent oxidoreductase
MPASPRLDIGIVGGSLAGCFAALELLSAGHRCAAG